MRCEECGREVSDEMKFCKFCGAPVVRHETVRLQKEVDPRQETDQIQCPSCGGMVWKADSFCPSCGYALRPGGTQRSRDTVHSPVVETPRQESSSWKALAIIGILLALVAAALLIFFVVTGHLGQKEQEETAEPSQTETADNIDVETADADNVEPEPAESDSTADSGGAPPARTGEERYFIKNTSSTLNLRKLPQHDSELVGTVSDQSLLYFYGNVAQGLGSDEKVHDWYKVILSDGTTGWARSDLLKEVSYDYVASSPASNDQARFFTKNTSSTLNLRKLPQHDSDLVGTVSDQSRLYFYGEVGQGLGSDGKTHDWYKVTTENGTVGWARSDLLREVYG